ncbi:MAG TPA: J domain-containing protein, partial [Acidimicrobiales bacterium]|nr:J domain-containing protein [Acidimicrobiales bacterium]
VQVSLTLDEAAFGVERQVSVTLPQRCATCAGSGCAPGTAPVTCEECQGTGEVRRVRSSFLGQMVTSAPCARCGATGQRIESPCRDCRGDGRVTATSTLTVSIPAGVEDGSTMRLADRGPAGPRGGPSGRLFVHLAVAPDARFERVGDDLHHEARLAFTQAALGATIEVPTLEGSASVEVEAGSANGTVHRLRHEGVPHLHGRGRGDLYVHLAVDVPSILDDESADLLRQLAAHRGEAVREPGGRLFARRGAKK